MRPLSRFTAGLCLVAFLTAQAVAGTPTTPLRLVSDSADLLVQIKNPRRLVETLTNLDALKQLEQFPSVKELLTSTTSRRYYQFLAYFEKKLGADRLELLDRLAGGGAVLATKFGNQAPALLVVQGKDEKLMKKFTEVALDLIEQELARQDVKARPVKGTYQGVETIRFGDFCAAVAGSTLLVSNKEEGLRKRSRSLCGKIEEEHGGGRRGGRCRRPAAGRNRSPACGSTWWASRNNRASRNSTPRRLDIAQTLRLRRHRGRAGPLAIRNHRPLSGQRRLAVERQAAARPRGHGRCSSGVPAAGRTSRAPGRR